MERSEEHGLTGRRLASFGLLYVLALVTFGAVALGLRWAIHLLPGQDAGAGGTPAPPATAAAGAGTAPRPEAATDRARFDIVRVAPDGRAVIAGHAPPGRTVEVTLDGKPIGTARADGSGSWLLLPHRRVAQGPLALAVRILGNADRGTP